MDWKYKALLQQLLSLIPGGESLNHQFQRRVTKRLPIGDASLQQSIKYAQRHVDAFSRRSHSALEEATFYEFGAGATLTIPLVLYACGVDRQVLVDIRPLARPELVEDLANRLRGRARASGLRPLPFRCYVDEPDLRMSLRDLGIEYLAPANARRTTLASGSIDWITSTNTLEHIPAPDVAPILKECRRLLADDGGISFLIDYKDHYSYFDTKLSPFNFLRYSAREWSLFNPSLHFQNRLRHRDYIELIEKAGLEIVEESRQDGSQADLEALKAMTIASSFKSYAVDELAVRSAFFVLRKTDDSPGG